jgi:hypothetical protein
MPAGAGREAHPAGHSFFGRGALVLVLLFGQVPLASGQEPDLMQTLIAEDATLNNNVSPIKPRWQKNAGGRTFELGFGVEKMLSPNLDVQIGGVWKSLRPRNGPAKTAFGNVDVELKYVFLKLPEFQVAVVPQVSFPTSSHTPYQFAHIGRANAGACGRVACLGRTAGQRVRAGLAKLSASDRVPRRSRIFP